MISTYTPSKRIILCIDEDVSILRYEKALLERSGYMVLTAVSPKQALRLVTMCDCDAVLLDYEILEMSGHEVALEIKLVRPEVKIILIADHEVPTQTLAVVDAFAPRVEESRQLLRMISEICSRGSDTRHRQGGIQREDRQ
jgi:DNA-binding NtrC family response regulator